MRYRPQRSVTISRDQAGFAANPETWFCLAVNGFLFLVFALAALTNHFDLDAALSLGLRPRLLIFACIIGGLAFLPLNYAALLFISAVSLEVCFRSLNAPLVDFMNAFFLVGSLVVYFKAGAPRLRAASYFLLLAALGFLVVFVQDMRLENLPNLNLFLQTMAGGFLIAWLPAFCDSRQRTTLVLWNCATALTLATALSVFFAYKVGLLGQVLTFDLQARLGNLGSQSSGSFAFLTLTGALCWFAWAEYAGSAFVSLAPAAACLLATALTKTISAVVTGAIAVPVALWCSRRSVMRKVLALAVVVLVFVSILKFDELTRGVIGFVGVQDRDVGTMSGRVLIWETQLEQIGNHPLGQSWAVYGVAAPRTTYRSIESGDSRQAVLTPHNVELAAFVFGGVLSGLAMTAFICAAAVAGLKRFMYGGKSRGVLLAIPAAAILCHQMTDVWYFCFYLAVAMVFVRVEDWRDDGDESGAGASLEGNDAADPRLPARELRKRRAKRAFGGGKPGRLDALESDQPGEGGGRRGSMERSSANREEPGGRAAVESTIPPGHE